MGSALHFLRKNEINKTSIHQRDNNKCYLGNSYTNEFIEDKLIKKNNLDVNKIVTQNEFLQKLGIIERANILAKKIVNKYSKFDFIVATNFFAQTNNLKGEVFYTGLLALAEGPKDKRSIVDILE